MMPSRRESLKAAAGYAYRVLAINPAGRSGRSTRAFAKCVSGHLPDEPPFLYADAMTLKRRQWEQ
jgi:hypothetical protein